MSLALAEFQAIVLVLCLLGAIIFGNEPVRITAVIVFSGIGAWMYWLDRRVRFQIGDRVRIKLGTHQGACGTVVEHLPGGRGVRVEVKHGSRTEIIDFHGGYEVECVTSSET